MFINVVFISFLNFNINIFKLLNYFTKKKHLNFSDFKKHITLFKKKDLYLNINVAKYLYKQ